jgi:hypothetical protein
MMNQRISQVLDNFSEFLARRKGLLPLIGILFIVVNFILQFFPGLGWLVRANLFLHLGVILSLIGFMLAWAL